MTIQFSRLRAISVAIMLLVTAASVPSRQSKEEALPNFHQVNKELYRGAQPLSGGMKELAALGIKTVINLRGEDERTRDEEAEAQAAGLRYFSVSLPGLKRPTHQQVEKILAFINDSQNWPVFVHCHHGEDRTGLIIAVYRISRDGWTAEQAKKEAKRHGMSRFQFGMKDYIKDYARDYKRPPVSRLMNWPFTIEALVPET